MSLHALVSHALEGKIASLGPYKFSGKLSYYTYIIVNRDCLYARKIIIVINKRNTVKRTENQDLDMTSVSQTDDLISIV